MKNIGRWLQCLSVFASFAFVPAGLAQVPCLPAPAGIVSWWPAESNADDIIGGNNGMIIGGLTFAPGEVGQAFDFSSTNSYISVPASPSLDVGEGSGFTIETWINPADVSARHPLAEWTSNGVFATQFWISVQIPGGGAGSVFASLYDAGNNPHWITSAPGLVQTNVFQHVAVTYDKASGNAVLYYNGAAVASMNLGSTTLNTTGDLLIGHRQTSGENYLGLMDETTLYGRALSAAEIAAIYNAGSAGKCSSSNGAAPTITSQPASELVNVGQTASFTVTASGSLPLMYQWNNLGGSIAGATNSTLTLSNAQTSETGSYYVTVSNPYGSTNSVNAMLVVTNLPSSCVPAPSGIISWWPAEGNANDIVGGNNGTIIGGVDFVPGEVGQAFYFSSTNSYISVPASPSLDVGQGSGFTIETWIAPADVSVEHPLAEWTPTNGVIGTHFWIDVPDLGGGTGSVFASLIDTANNAHWISSPSGLVQTNVFQHVAVTYDQASGNAVLYYNGAAVASINLGSATLNTTGPLLLGHRQSTGENYLGRMDEMTLYGRALSASEIAAIYNAGSAGKCSSSNGVAPMITSQPTSELVNVGQTASFTVTASGSPPLMYQWNNLGGSIAGATNATLTLSNAQTSETGSYYVTVSNPYGSTNSVNAMLVVTNLPSSCTPVPSGAVAWWRGESNSFDSMYGNNGVFIGTESYAPGEVGTAFNFNGSSYVEVPDSPTLRFTNGMTVEAWVNLNQYTGNATEILSKFAALPLNANSYTLSIEGANTAPTHRAYFIVNGTNYVPLQLFSSTDIPTNQWVHIAGTYDGVLMKIYINGALSASAPFTNEIWPGTQPLSIGCSIDGGPVSLFNGQIDEVSLYARALSASEISAIYDAGSAGKCFVPELPSITGQPGNETAPVGGTASFTVTAVGSPPLTYQWYNGSGSITGATNATLTLSNAQSSETGSYYVTVSNPYGSTNSVNAMLVVTNLGGVAPTITSQPESELVNVGQTASFTVTASGSPPLTYQWYNFSGSIPGATNTTLTLSNAQLSETGSYYVTVSNPYGSTNSVSAMLVVTNLPSSCTPAPSGLVGWWRAEGNAFDSAGDNNAVITGAVSYATGEVGQAFLFTDTNEDIYVPSNSVLNVGLDAGFTLEAWINPQDVTQRHPIFEWNVGDGVTYWGVHFYIDPITPGGSVPGTLYCNVQEVGDIWHQMWSAGNVVVTNEFQHVALTYDKTSGIATIYWNGQIVAQQTMGDFTPKTTGPLHIGRRPTSPSGNRYTFAGMIDEASVYSRALSQSEIQSIYDAGSAGKCSSSNSMAPTITSQPTSEVVNVGQTASFTVTASGSPPLVYQWYNLGGIIAGATNTTLTLSNAQLSETGSYYVAVSNPYGSTNSVSAMLIVTNLGLAPTITSQPESELVNVGQTASFTVTASGSPPLMYQWYNFSGSIAGATNSTLTLSNAQLSETGSYYVTVSNPYGSTNSVNAMLVVTNPPSSCTPAPSGLVGWWRAEGNAFDSAGDNNGVITGAVSFAAGEVGQAFLFTDTNEDIVIPASSNLNVGLGAGLTLEAWINPRDVTNYNPIFEWNPGDGTNYWGVQMYVVSEGVYNSSPVPGTLYANVQGVGDVWHQLWSAPGTVTNGGFQHVALTYDKASGVATLYCNGALVAQQTFGSFTPKTFANLHIGRRPIDPAGSRFTFGGLIDEASVYNRALSQSEIQSIYNAGSAGKCFVPPASAAPVITSFSPDSGLAGIPVTITGSNFATSAAGDIVYFGAVQAVVTAGNTSNLTVIAPTNATFAPISVTVDGLTGYSEQFYLPDFHGAGPLTNTSFAPAFNLNTPNGPNRVYIADLDGDGRPDVLVANNYAGTISIFQNISSNGFLSAASFAPRVDLVVGANGGGADPYTLAVADLDGDGKLDIVALNADSNIVSIFRNISTPGLLTSNSFAPRLDLPGGRAMRGVAVQDLDGDGRPEIIVGNSGDNNVSIYKNDSTIGSIAFAPRVNLPAGSEATTVVVGDLDGDGLPDIAVANYTGASISVFRNLGFTGTITTNSFAPAVNFAAPASPFGLALGDIDGDGKLDMVVGGNIDSMVVSVLRNTSTPGSIGASSFAPHVDFSLPGWANFVALADLDGDGKLDIAAVTQLGSSFSLFRNISTPGSFTTASLAPRIDLPAGYNANGVSIGDLNGDGRPDVVFANSYDNTLSIYQNVSLTTGNPPSITAEPVNQNVIVGQTTSFFVGAAGSPTLSYQWFNSSGKIAGATNAQLVLSNTQPSQAGPYHAVVSNPYGSTNSSNAVLTVNSLPATVQVVNTTPSPAGTNVVDVPINFVANGNEHALGFSLNFDTNWLAYKFAVIGSGASGATLLSTNVPNGKVGIRLTLPSGKTFNPGTNQILFVTFTTPTLTNTQPVTTVISFGNQPVSESLTDTNNNPLAFSLLSGTVTLPPKPGTSSSVAVNSPPNLSISSSGANAVLSWPASAGVFSVQAAGSMTPPITWTNVPVTLQTNGGNIQVTLPASAPQTFFRLSYP